MSKPLLRSSAIITLLTALAAAHAGDSDATDACIDVEVNGQRSLSIQCLNDQLRPETAATHARDMPHLASERAVSMPPNQLGLYNRAALINRMGSNFGRSAHPYRPAVTHPLPPLLQNRQSP